MGPGSTPPTSPLPSWSPSLATGCCPTGQARVAGQAVTGPQSPRTLHRATSSFTAIWRCHLTHQMFITFTWLFRRSCIGQCQPTCISCRPKQRTLMGAELPAKAPQEGGLRNEEKGPEMLAVWGRPVWRQTGVNFFVVVTVLIYWIEVLPSSF